MYLISCANCPLKYVEQTKWKLRKRINEHKRNINEPMAIQNLVQYRLKHDTLVKFSQCQDAHYRKHYCDSLTTQTLNVKIRM